MLQTDTHQPTGLLRRRNFLLASAAALAGCKPELVVRRPGALELLGETSIAHKFSFRNTTVGGLSAIDHDPETGLFELLSDDRSDWQPARFYHAHIELKAGGLGPVELQEVITLRQADGQTWPNRRNAPAKLPVQDAEGLRRLPNGNLLWTSEGDRPRSFTPMLHEANAQGQLLRQFGLPACFNIAERHGARDNLAFEGLALNAAGTLAWAAMENALQQDGLPPSTDSAGGPCRFTQFDVSKGRAIRQIAYQPDAIPAPPIVPGTYADNGVSEILLQDEHHMLVLERAYMMGRGNSLRLYRIDTRAATDTLNLDTLTPANHRAAPKTLIADFAQLGLSRLDNTEGMCWGPRLPDGRRTLWTVSDDNFNPGQITQIAAFAFSGSASQLPKTSEQKV